MRQIIPNIWHKIKERIPIRFKLGFTLIELLVVISIIGIIATIGMAVYSGARGKADEGKRRADVAAIAKAFEIKYDEDTGLYSTPTAGDFSNGDPIASGNYIISIPSPATSFRVCTTIGSGTSVDCGSSVATPDKDKCYCVSANQGEFIASAVSTPAPTPTITPPPATKKYTCDSNTSSRIPNLDGSDPNLVNIGTGWLALYTIPNTAALPPTTNIYMGYLGNSSLGALVSEWVALGTVVPLSPGAWDDEVTETASFVYGWSQNRLQGGAGYESRIYYVGSDDRGGKPLKMGIIYRNEATGTWHRYTSPVLAGLEWWEMFSPRIPAEFGEPSVVYQNGPDPDGGHGTWHMYYQTGSNQTATNGYPTFSEGWFIGHRTSTDGVNWSAPIGFGGHPWMYTSVTFLGITPVSGTGFTKPEVRLTPSGSVQWVGGNNKDNVRYGEAPNLNSALTHEELLFTVDDCKTKGSGCNWRIDTGHTFGVDSIDGGLWVYFTATECLSGARPPSNSCASVKWNTARVKCNKNP